MLPRDLCKVGEVVGCAVGPPEFSVKTILSNASVKKKINNDLDFSH